MLTRHQKISLMLKSNGKKTVGISMHVWSAKLRGQHFDIDVQAKMSSSGWQCSKHKTFQLPNLNRVFGSLWPSKRQLHC